MLSVGFRDLSTRQLVGLLLGKVRLAADPKALREFSASPHSASSDKTTESFERLAKFLNEKEKFTGSVLLRSLKLSVVLYSLQVRARVSADAFRDSVELFNTEERETDFTPPTFCFAERGTELTDLLASDGPAILSRAELLADYLMLQLFVPLSKVESCLYAEATGVDPSFLADIEKVMGEDRQMVRTVRSFANYFKRTQRASGAPPEQFVAEILRTNAIETTLDTFGKMLGAFLSFEKKPELNGALLLSQAPLAAFSRGAELQNCALIDAVKELGRIKKNRLAVEEDVSSRFGLLIEELRRCQKTLFAEVEETPKRSESFVALHALFQQIGCTREAVQPPAGFDLDALSRGLENVLAPLVERLKKPKAPKGTQDCMPAQMVIKREAIDIIKRIYLDHGAVEIDTPVFELRETLLGKYGDEGGKLIYNLEDQGGELLSLRYDLTVPFARFMACHNLQRLKRFHIGKVYRRDQPNMNRGRFREFYHCDFDIAGNTGLMIAEAEVLHITAEILTKLRFERLGLCFRIKVSHRELLEAIVVSAGCDLAKFKAICSSIDKLDKDPWAAVQKELIEEKGLLPEQCEKIESLVSIRGSLSKVIAQLRTNELLGTHAKTTRVLDEMKVLEGYLTALGVDENVEFDLSLARGLDYYTGLIYEAVLEGNSAVGSIAGGGRYDELIGIFSAQKIPAVGVSIGIERIFSLFEEKFLGEYRSTKTQVLVCSIGKGLVEEKLKLLRELWKNGVAAETLYDENPKPDKQIKAALEAKIPYLIWIGENELARGILKLKNLEKKTEEDVSRENIVEKIKELLP